jgi:hypothetical protein
MKRFGNPIACAAMMGNIDDETGGSYNYKQREKKEKG